MAGRLLAVSDLHVGYPENRAYADALAPGDPGDWLIVAGDVGETFADVGFVLASLASRFATVIWTPGNHELWTLPSDQVPLRGVARYEALLKVCRRFGVLTPEDDFPVWNGPGGPVTVAPLFTLYDYSFPADGTAAAMPTELAEPAPADSVPADTGQAADDEHRKSAALAAAQASGVSAADEGRLHADPYPSVAAWCRDRVAATERRLAAVTGPVVLASHWPLLRDPVRALRHQAYAPWCGTTADRGLAHEAPGSRLRLRSPAHPAQHAPRRGALRGGLGRLPTPVAAPGKRAPAAAGHPRELAPAMRQDALEADFGVPWPVVAREGAGHGEAERGMEGDRRRVDRGRDSLDNGAAIRRSEGEEPFVEPPGDTAAALARVYADEVDVCRVGQ